jgi:hypothetical protein
MQAEERRKAEEGPVSEVFRSLHPRSCVALVSLQLDFLFSLVLPLLSLLFFVEVLVVCVIV